MDSLAGKVAFVTGGASGIGLGMAEAFGRVGMKIMLADIEVARLEESVAGLKAAGVDADGIVVDVAIRQQLVNAAAKTAERFGKVHVLCNNAGVTANGRFGELTPGDWDWVIDIDLMGVIYGTEAFLPYLKAHGEGAHIVKADIMATNGIIHIIDKVLIPKSVLADLERQPDLTTVAGVGDADHGDAGVIEVGDSDAMDTEAIHSGQ